MQVTGLGCHMPASKFTAFLSNMCGLIMKIKREERREVGGRKTARRWQQYWFTPKPWSIPVDYYEFHGEHNVMTSLLFCLSTELTGISDSFNRVDSTLCIGHMGRKRICEAE